MNELQSIFLRPGITAQVETTHQNIINGCNALPLLNGERCLFDVLLSPPSQKSYPEIWRDRVISALEADKPAMPPINDIGHFSMVEIASLTGSYAFMRECQRNGQEKILYKPNPKWEELCDLTILPYCSASVLLSIKYFWLVKDYPQEKYYGFLPHSSPIKNITKALWGTSFNSAMHATMFQVRLAKDLGQTPFWVNTALWELWYRLSAK